MNQQDSPKAARFSLADRVYAALQARVVNGDYAPQQKLPPEKELSVEFGVSRPVLRAALERLRTEGLISSRQGAGNFIRGKATPPPLGFQKVETIADIQRCYEFRLAVEVDAAGFAAQRRNEAALEEMASALRLLAAATGSRVHREDADFAFHHAITKASNNQYFVATLQALREHINVGMKLHGESLMSDGAKALESVLGEHTAIHEAIRDGDADAARNRMRQHILHSRSRLFGGSLLDLKM